MLRFEFEDFADEAEDDGVRGGKAEGPKREAKGPPPFSSDEERYLMTDQILVLSLVLNAVRRKDVVALKLGGNGAVGVRDDVDDETEATEGDKDEDVGGMKRR